MAFNIQDIIEIIRNTPIEDVKFSDNQGGRMLQGNDGATVTIYSNGNMFISIQNTKVENNQKHKEMFEEIWKDVLKRELGEK